MKKAVLCSYHYDPLDRLAGTTPALQSGSLRFYCQNRIVTEIQGSTQHSIMQCGDQLLAQHTSEPNHQNNTLLATDSQRSVLHTTTSTEQREIAYSAFGHHPIENANTHLLGFSGERAEQVTGHYLLGNGYRSFNTVLMRFNSPDSWSPFGAAGINAYAYCLNNPINQRDPSGHISFKQAVYKILDKVRPLKVKSITERLKRGHRSITTNVPATDNSPRTRLTSRVDNNGKTVHRLFATHEKRLQTITSSSSTSRSPRQLHIDETSFGGLFSTGYQPARLNDLSYSAVPGEVLNSSTFPPGASTRLRPYLDQINYENRVLKAIYETKTDINTHNAPDEIMNKINRLNTHIQNGLVNGIRGKNLTYRTNINEPF